MVRTPVLQTLSSGLRIRQDFRDSVRFVMFDSGMDAWRYATHGGTAFVVNYRGRCFGASARHVLGDFDWRQLAITDEKFGRVRAGLKAMYYPSNPSEGAVASDVLDIVVIEFSDDVNPEFFRDAAYVLDPGTIATSRLGDALNVNGNLKESTVIDDTRIAPTFGLLEFLDDGPTEFDPTLRKAIARFENPEFTSLTGMSGAPVFNTSTNRLCGVVIRGGVTEGDPATYDATIYYLDFFDVMKALEGVDNGSLDARYNKPIAVPR